MLNLFRKKEKREHREEFKRRVNSLKDMLSLNDPLVVAYMGPSPFFLRYSAETQGSYSIPERLEIGSISNLAESELVKIYETTENLFERYHSGRSLGLRPLEILERHKSGNQSEPAYSQRKNESKKRFENLRGLIRINKELHDLRKACEGFEEQYPGERAVYHQTMEIRFKEEKSEYEVRVFAFSPFQKNVHLTSRGFTSPINQDEMREHIDSLPGEISYSLINRAA